MKTDKDIKERAKILIQILDLHKFNFEIFEFNSGAIMIDINIKSDFYCIQMTENKFGWTKVDEHSGFSTIPDSGYLNWGDFKNDFDEIIKKYT